MTVVPTPASELPQNGAELTSVDFKPRRKRGPMSKIAQLPGHQRMLINRLLDDDKTYEEIVQEMAKHNVQLNTDNISKWYTGPPPTTNHSLSHRMGEGPGVMAITTNHEPRTTNEPQIKNRNSKIENPEERCHCCRRFLPPRLPNGQRPSNLCSYCGTALHALELLHLYCPTCGGRMDSIFDNDHRTSDHCPHCFTTLPDDTDPPNAA